MNELRIRIKLPSCPDGLRKIQLHRLMITAIHEQQLACGRIFLGIRQLPFPELFCPGFVYRHFVPVRIPVGEQNAQHLRAIRPFPDQLGEGGLISSVGHGIIEACGLHSSPEEGVRNARLPHQLRGLADQSKGIGEVSDLGRLSVSIGILMPNLHIADIRFTARKECILQNIPRSNDQTPRRNVLLQAIQVLWTNLQIVLQNNRLTIQIKAFEFTISIQLIQQCIHQLNEPDMVLLIGQIPFPVPMGVGDDMS
ncbi:hypothetical protein D3C72_748380 [compost metagenome]